MSEKYYSTLTNDLARQYRIALAKRLTNYNPGIRSDFNQLKILTSEESSANLNRLLSLKRPDVFRREQDEALSLVGIKRRKRGNKQPRPRTGSSFLQSERTYSSRPSTGAEKTVTTPRWFKHGGGDITIHHRGRCSFDPKVMSINTPGPQAYSNTHGLVGHKKIKGGSFFGRSKSQRTQLGKSEARNKKRVTRADEEEAELRRMKAKSKYNRSATAPARSPLRKLPVQRAPFGTSGPRTHPLAQRNEMLGCGATRGGADRWSSPGPRYNVRADATYRLPGVPVTYGKTTKFSTSSRLPKAKKSIGPGPVYMPSYKVVEKSPTNPTMCPRRSYGSLYERADKSDGPGPSYLPKFDNKGHISTAPSFSFGDHDPRFRPSKSASSLSTMRPGSRGSKSHAVPKQRSGHQPLYQPSKELLAEASIAEMRSSIWKKIRGGGQADSLYMIMDS